ncbi:hypothetical protein ACLMJK_007176 [Lecanora helva]
MLSRRQLVTSACISYGTIIRFHTGPVWKREIINYYATLGLQNDAPAGEIKKHFYQLSKTHHPDRNPNDPQASDRFVQISEAYAVLGDPQKRERYDKDLQSAQGERNSRYARPGSHSSSSTPFGSRPASGLSKRRTQFKGPPPSFYRNGGWGRHGARRQSQADAAAQAANAGAGAGNSNGGGFGPGQGFAGLHDDVPHFDRKGHIRTQVRQEQRWSRRAQREGGTHVDGGGVLVKFALISSVVVFAISVPTWFENSLKRRRIKEES